MPLRELQQGPIRLLQFPLLADRTDVIHAITTRFAFTKEGKRQWNLSGTHGPEKDRALENRRQLCELLDLNPAKLTSFRQVHGNRVAVVPGSEKPPSRADGMVCQTPGVALMTLSADCPCILLFDPQRRAIGNCHAGWRGLACGIVRNTVTAMIRQYASRPEDLLAGIGPCAGPERYQVGSEVRAALPDHAGHFRPDGPGHWRLDMSAVVREQLITVGLDSRNIESADLCTIQRSDLFYSYRRDASEKPPSGASTGRFALLIAG